MISLGQQFLLCDPGSTQDDSWPRPGGTGCGKSLACQSMGTPLGDGLTNATHAPESRACCVNVRAREHGHSASGSTGSAQKMFALCMRRAVAMSKAKPKSAVVCVNNPAYWWQHSRCVMASKSSCCSPQPYWRRFSDRDKQPTQWHQCAGSGGKKPACLEVVRSIRAVSTTHRPGWMYLKCCSSCINTSGNTARASRIEGFHTKLMG